MTHILFTLIHMIRSRCQLYLSFPDISINGGASSGVGEWEVWSLCIFNSTSSNKTTSCLQHRTSHASALLSRESSFQNRALRLMGKMSHVTGDGNLDQGSQATASATASNTGHCAYGDSLPLRAPGQLSTRLEALCTSCLGIRAASGVTMKRIKYKKPLICNNYLPGCCRKHMMRARIGRSEHDSHTGIEAQRAGVPASRRNI